MAAPTDPTVLRRWCDLALARLSESRAEIDGLNVYPVPDRDTGTNLYLTLEAGQRAVEASAAVEPGALAAALAAGALRGARGSSGVILSQLLTAAAESLAAAADKEPPETFAAAVSHAADAAYTAVQDPVEGTMLSVARSAATAAGEYVEIHSPASADTDQELAEAVSAAAAAAATALAATPDQLPVLREAGVVDAGGRGLCVLLDAAEEIFTGRPTARSYPTGTATGQAGCVTHEARAGGPSYEVMYLLDADDGRIPALRERLADLGEDLVVVGGGGLWNVHVHVDDVGSAIEAGIAAGRPHAVRVTALDGAVVAGAAGSNAEHAAAVPVGLVAVVAGSGLAELFRAAGATVAGTPGRTCSAAELLSAIRSTGCQDVVVLPNDARTLDAADTAARAARHDGVRVVVVPTRAQLEGLAAVAVHQASAGFDAEVVAMSSAASHVRHGAVTIANQNAMTTVGPCRAGDVLGIVDGDFAVIGDDLADVAMAVVDRLLGAGGELLTLVAGVGEDGTVDRVTAHVRQLAPNVEVAVHDGGQERYPLLIGVE